MGDRPRKSWREIDATRDRGGPRPPRQEGAGRGKEAARQKSYRAALDRLFESGGIGKLVAEREGPSVAAEDSRTKRLEAVRAAIGPTEITRSIDAFVAAHGWPDGEIDFASAALEHRDPSVVERALADLERALAAERPRRVATLQGRLRTLEELSDSEEIRARAAALRAKL